MPKVEAAEFITISQMARLANVSRDIAQYWADKGFVKSVNFPGRKTRDIRRITRASYDEFCKKYANQKPNPRRRRRT